MKIQAYLDAMKRMIMNESDVHLKTFKRCLELFKENLSDTEYTRWIIDIDIINEVNTTQLSLKSAYQLAIEKGILTKNGDKIE